MQQGHSVLTRGLGLNVFVFKNFYRSMTNIWRWCWHISCYLTPSNTAANFRGNLYFLLTNTACQNVVDLTQNDPVVWIWTTVICLQNIFCLLRNLLFILQIILFVTLQHPTLVNYWTWNLGLKFRTSSFETNTILSQEFFFLVGLSQDKV